MSSGVHVQGVSVQGVHVLGVSVWGVSVRGEGGGRSLSSTRYYYFKKSYFKQYSGVISGFHHFDYQY